MSNVNATNTNTGFAWNPYQKPTVTAAPGPQGTYNFFRPNDSALPSGAALTQFIEPQGADTTGFQSQNRTVKYDGGLTREQMANSTDFLNNQMGTGFAGVQGSLTGLNSNLNTGLADVNTNLGTVNTGVTNVGNEVVKGNTANTAGFAGMNTQFGKAFDQIGALGTQTGNYFTQLAAAQDKTNTGLTGLTDTFGDYRKSYDVNTARNDQAQTQIKNNISGAVGTLGNKITGTAAATQDTINDLRGGMSPAGSTAANSMMSNVAGTGFAGGAAQSQPSPSGPAGSSAPLVQSISKMMNLIQTQGQQMGPELYNAFSQIVGSFGQNGELIPESQSQNGILTRRQMDQQGNLVFSQSAPNGEVLSQSMVNLNASMAAANSLG